MTATYVAANNGENLLILVGDGASPENFAAPAVVNSKRGVNLKTTQKATEIPRTDNPSAPAKTRRAVTAVDWDIDGSGLVNTGDDKSYADWLLSGLPKNIKVINSITGGLVLTGSALLTEYDMSGDRGDMIENTIKLMGADLPTTSVSG